MRTRYRFLGQVPAVIAGHERGDRKQEWAALPSARSPGAKHDGVVDAFNGDQATDPCVAAFVLPELAGFKLHAQSIGRDALVLCDTADVRVAFGRTLSRKEREYVRVQLELGLSVSEIVAGLQR